MIIEYSHGGSYDVDDRHDIIMSYVAISTITTESLTGFTTIIQCEAIIHDSQVYDGLKKLNKPYLGSTL